MLFCFLGGADYWIIAGDTTFGFSSMGSLAFTGFGVAY